MQICRSNQIAIRAQGISKCYQIYARPEDRLKQSILPRIQRLVKRPPRQYFQEFWALKDVFFEVKKGETVGLIGRNGSGKSTLLQIICGTLAQSGGIVETNGRIAALLELGSGFNPEFTGFENIYMNGAVLGLSRQEIDDRLTDIIAFADIGKFIEQPVKTYSSGMLVRLAFSVNIMTEPQVMVIDEALSVGDMNFQAKCMTALNRIQNKGATILFVSHDMGSVKSLCSRAIYLEDGEVIASGTSAEVAEQYIRDMREEMNEGRQKTTDEFNTTIDNHEMAIEKSNHSTARPVTEFKTSDEFTARVTQFRYGTGHVKVSFVEFMNRNNEPIKFVEFNQKVKIRIYVEAYEEKKVSVSFFVLDSKGVSLTGCGFHQVDQAFLATESEGKYLIEYRLRLPLKEGNYSLRVQITEPIIQGKTSEFLDVIENAAVFRINRWEKSIVWSRVHLFPEIALKRLA